MIEFIKDYWVNLITPTILFGAILFFQRKSMIKKESIITLMYFAFAISLAYIAMKYGPLVLSELIVKPNGLEEAAKLGDSFGPLTSVFSFLGFLGLFWTIQIQRGQIADQRKDYERDRTIAHFQLVHILWQTAESKLDYLEKRRDAITTNSARREDDADEIKKRQGEALELKNKYESVLVELSKKILSDIDGSDLIDRLFLSERDIK